MRIEISIDDGHKQDLRVAELLEKYGMRGMFYIPAINRGHRDQAGLSDKEVRTLSEKHDIGFHSWSHPQDLKSMEDDREVMRQVTHGREQMEKLIGRPITSFCYPRGRYDDRAVRAVRAAGYVEARTVDVGHTSEAYDPHRKPTTVHIHPRRKEYGDQHWLEYAKEKLAEAMRDEHGYFHIWGHGWEIEKFDLWSELEEFLCILEKYAKKEGAM